MVSTVEQNPDLGLESMYIKTLLGIAVILSLVIACGSGNSEKGVARIDTAPATQPAASSIVHAEAQPSPVAATTESSEANDEPKLVDNLTDEQIATNFTTCLREQGFDVPDPELNADGTVNLRGIRQKLVQDPNFDFRQQKTRQAMEACVPLLEGATFAQEQSAEDQIALQDNLLTFAQCLRDAGVDVKDPQFSDGPRAIRRAMTSMFQGGDFTEKMRETVDECRQEIFGGNIRGNR